MADKQPEKRKSEHIERIIRESIDHTEKHVEGQYSKGSERKDYKAPMPPTGMDPSGGNKKS